MNDIQMLQVCITVVIVVIVLQVQDSKNEVVVEFTPTIPHCSMATLIGLCIRVKLFRVLPSRFKVCY